MPGYTIIISETQRKALLELITSEAGRAVIAASEHKDEHEPRALTFWESMLASLPEDDRPGLTHGFCL